jgi:hypothetical protein
MSLLLSLESGITLVRKNLKLTEALNLLKVTEMVNGDTTIQTQFLLV